MPLPRLLLSRRTFVIALSAATALPALKPASSAHDQAPSMPAPIPTATDVAKRRFPVGVL